MLWLLFPKALCRQGCRRLWLAFFFSVSQKRGPKFAQMPSGWGENGVQQPKGIISGPSPSSAGLGRDVGKSSAQLAIELFANAQ